MRSLLYMITPEKYHDKIAAIIHREWESRTQQERESYAAKIVEALTEVVLKEATKEATTGEIFVPIREIKLHYDLRYGDRWTGKGKTNPRTIGRVISNLGLRTDQFRVKDEDERLRGWRLDKAELVKIRQSLYLDEVPEFVSNVSNVSSVSVCSASSSSSGIRPISAIPLETNETKLHS